MCYVSASRYACHQYTEDAFSKISPPSRGLPHRCMAVPLSYMYDLDHSLASTLLWRSACEWKSLGGEIGEFLATNFYFYLHCQGGTSFT